MSQICYFPGCEPGSSSAPKTKIIELMDRETVITNLTALREHLEKSGDPDEPISRAWWMLLLDVLYALQLGDADTQARILGPVVCEILDRAYVRVPEAAQQ